MKTRRGEENTSRRAEARPRLDGPPAIITLLTDYGSNDHFVGSLKGAVLSINPRVCIVDITHEIPAHDVEAGAFALLAAYRSFPPQTINIAVVDPEVGSTRRPILLRAGGHFFVGPDNGLFSYVCDTEISHQAFHVVRESYFRHPVSSTFHGRDVFAPVAAALSLGVKPSAFGPEISDLVCLASLRPGEGKNGRLEGRIIHVDRFGNCITNFTREHISVGLQSNASLQVSGRTIRSFRTFFDDTSSSAKVFAIWGSAGFLEIAASRRSAARLLRAHRGQPVVLEIRKK